MAEEDEIIIMHHDHYSRLGRADLADHVGHFANASASGLAQLCE